MPFVPFHELLPDVAERETRDVMVLPGSNVGLPPGHYGFLEMYCDEEGCDCRRVFLTVVSSARGKVEAVIAWGWEKPAFYAKWMHDDDPQTVASLVGPILNFGSPATKLAPALLLLFENVLLKDQKYVERIKRHYRMFRDKIEEGATH